MAQVYAQQAKVVGASPDGDKPMNADGVVSEVAPDSTTKDVNSKKAEESDVSDEEPGDDLPFESAHVSGTSLMVSDLKGRESSRTKASEIQMQNSRASKGIAFLKVIMTANPAIAPASMWNRQDIVEFKNAIRKEGAEGIIKVGHGETVTVRVPTHEEGTCLFWEFATDYYDIGFGVLFEWTIAESNQVAFEVENNACRRTLF
uniref:GOLD domain-containing protein n=1 Tax=Ascaris lumbricoides TaxID=6252 RepID=A0A0M3IDL0_ASCLU